MDLQEAHVRPALPANAYPICEQPGCQLLRGHRARRRPLHFAAGRGCWFTLEELFEALLVPGSDLEKPLNELIGAHVLAAVALFGWLEPARPEGKIERWIREQAET